MVESVEILIKRTDICTNFIVVSLNQVMKHANLN